MMVQQVVVLHAAIMSLILGTSYYMYSQGCQEHEQSVRFIFLVLPGVAPILKKAKSVLTSFAYFSHLCKTTELSFRNSMQLLLFLAQTDYKNFFQSICSNQYSS